MGILIFEGHKFCPAISLYKLADCQAQTFNPKRSSGLRKRLIDDQHARKHENPFCEIAIAIAI